MKRNVFKGSVLLFLSVSSFFTFVFVSYFPTVAEAAGGCVTITVQYKDGFPRSNADVKTIVAPNDPQWRYIGTTNSSGQTTRYDYLESGDYVIQAWWQGSQFGPNTYLGVDEDGNGDAIIPANYEIMPPVIEILSPQNKTYTSSSVPLTFTIYDFSAISWIGYSLDEQVNVTVTGDTTLSSLSYGHHNVAVYANDTFGNMGASNKIFFSIAIIVPDHYPTIQEAINHANERDTISVRNGTYYENVVVNKTVSLVGENRSTTIIDGNGAGTVISIQASGVNISEFTIQNGHCGIFSNSNYNVIKNNLVSHNFEAANLYSNGTSIIGNLIKDNIRGLMLEHSSGNTIIGNVISNCGNATFLWYSTDNVVSGNVLSKNFCWAMPICGSHNNIITNNTLLSNDSGIFLEYSHNNAVSENNLVGSFRYGIHLCDAFNNSIHHNNLFNNTEQVYDEAWTNPEIGNSVNSWNTSYGSSGNYWSNYVGVDEKSGPNQDQLGSDGIGDTPYIIDENNLDNYPLMTPWRLLDLTVRAFGIEEISNVQVWIDSEQSAYFSPACIRTYTGLHTIRAKYGFVEQGPEPDSYIKYVFMCWEDLSTNNIRTILLDEEKTIIAFYKWKIICLW